MNIQSPNQTQKNQKAALKEQAKQLLLKGCYKMACNKYLRLIALGLQNLQKRQCAIVYLNCGICFQFMSQFQDALKMISKSIQIDPGYQKAYYRRLQLLRDNQYYEQALKSIPEWIHNTQIDLLIKQIKQQYFENMGLNRLQQKIREKTVDLKMISEVYSKFYVKIDAKLENKQIQQEQAQKLAVNLKSHYHFMRTYYLAHLIYQQKNTDFAKYFQLFFQMMLKLLLLKHEMISIILSQFLIQFKTNLQNFMKTKAVKRSAKNQIMSNINLKENLSLELSKGQIRLIPFLKCYQQTQFFVKVCSFLTQTFYIRINPKFVGQIFENRSKIWLQYVDAAYIHVFLGTNSVDPKVQIKTTLKIQELQRLRNIIQYDCKKLKQFYDNSKLSLQKFKYLHSIIMMIDSQIKILWSLQQALKKQLTKTGKIQISKFCPPSLNAVEFTNLMYVRNWQILNKTKVQKINQQNNFEYVYNKEQLVNYVIENIKNFLVTYLFEHIVQFIPKEITRDMINVCQQSLQQIKVEIGKYKKNSKQSNLKQELLYQRYLILLVITLKIDIKRKISVQMSIFQSIEHDLLSDVSLQSLLLILLNSPVHINHFLVNAKKIANLITHFLTKPFIEQLDSITIMVNILFILVCDFQSEQQKIFAKNLGVTAQQVHCARKLQGEAQEQFKRRQVNANRVKFIQIVSNQGIQILIKLVNLCKKMQMQAYISDKLTKIIYAIASINHSKLYQFQIVDFMLQCKTLKASQNSKTNNNNYNETVCKFFQILCKKCYHNIFQYKNLQLIVDCLVWLIANSDHELVIFESLLGLVNLSTATVKIPIQEIQKCLYEQNMYIVHAAICIMNNILIYNQDYIQEEENKKFKIRISDLVCKYVQFYRDQIMIRQIDMPDSDYSHPHKIYSSLLSLSTVLKLHKLQQLSSWEGCKKYIKLLGKQSSQALFKLVVYHSLQKSLPKNWKHDFQCQLKDLQIKDQQKYNKILQLD